MRAVHRLVKGFYRAMVAAGWMWLGVAMPPPVTPQRPLRPPPPGYPERLRPDVPLTSTERALERQLKRP